MVLATQIVAVRRTTESNQCGDLIKNACVCVLRNFMLSFSFRGKAVGNKEQLLFLEELACGSSLMFFRFDCNSIRSSNNNRIRGLEVGFLL